MGPIAGLLVEYLVIGAVAGVWVIPLALSEIQSRPQFQNEITGIVLGALVPALYVVGMVCDLIGQKLTHRIKSRIEKKVGTEQSSQLIHAFSVAFEPSIAREIDARSTRDRIARGSLVAALPLVAYWPYTFISRWAALIIGLVTVASLALLWYRTQKLSSTYEAQVLKVLSIKHGDAFRSVFANKATARDA